MILNYRIKPELLGNEIAVMENGRASTNKDGYSNALKERTQLHVIIGEDEDIPKAITYENNDYSMPILPNRSLDISKYIVE